MDPENTTTATAPAPTVVFERPHEQETLAELRDLHRTYTDLLDRADDARIALHEAVRRANRVQGIKQETIGDAIGGVSKSRVYAIINALDSKAEQEAS